MNAGRLVNSRLPTFLKKLMKNRIRLIIGRARPVRPALIRSSPADLLINDGVCYIRGLAFGTIQWLAHVYTAAL